MNRDFMFNVYASKLLLDCFFTFRANILPVFFLKVRLVVAGGFAVTVADGVAAHFTFAASVAYS